MRVNPPFTSGKIILNYQGSRCQFINNNLKTSIVYVRTNAKVINEAEYLLAEIELLDGRKIMFSLISNRMYIQKMIDEELQWILYENHYVDIDYIYIDNKFSIFKGIIYYPIELNGELISENYSYDIIFTNTSQIWRELKKSEHTYHDNYDINLEKKPINTSENDINVDEIFK